MGVPPCLPRHLIALHGLVTANHVLEGSGEHVVYTWLAVCSRRPFVKHKLGLAFPVFDALSEYVILFPVIQDGFFYLGKGLFWINPLETCHGVHSQSIS